MNQILDLSYTYQSNFYYGVLLLSMTMYVMYVVYHHSPVLDLCTGISRQGCSIAALTIYSCVLVAHCGNADVHRH